MGGGVGGTPAGTGEPSIRFVWFCRAMLGCFIAGVALMAAGHQLAPTTPLTTTTTTEADMGLTLTDMGLGPITLGMDWPAALAAGVTPGPSSAMCWHGTFGLAIVVGTGDPKTVSSITLDNGTVRTSDGFRVGDTEGDVLKRYPDARRVGHALEVGSLTFGLRHGLVVYIRAGAAAECK